MKIFCCCFILFLTAFASKAQSDSKSGHFADQSYYLIDSLVLGDLSKLDQLLVDTSLKQYHLSSQDTSRLKHIGRVISNCHHTATWVRYNSFMAQLVTKGLSEDVPPEIRKKLTVFLGSTYSNKGAFENINGNVNEALAFYREAFAVYESVDHIQGMASALNNVGYVFNDIGDIPNALATFHESLLLKERIGHKVGIVTALNNIGYMYEHQGEVSQALEAYNRALALSEEINDTNGIADILTNIGYLYKQQGEWDKAHAYYTRSLKMDSITGYMSGLASSLNNIGFLLKSKGQPERAMAYYLRSLAIRDSMQNPRASVGVLQNIAELELDNGNITSAMQRAGRALELAQELGYPDKISGAAALLTDIFKKTKEYSKALAMYELHIVMRDSVKNDKTEKATIRQQTKYEFEKAELVKEQEEKEQTRIARDIRSRRDNLQYSIVLICLLVIGLTVAMLGRLSLPVKVMEGLIFFAFLIFFEFLLVLADPYINLWSGDAPGWKLLINAAIAAFIFPLHSLFEKKLKGKLAEDIIEQE